MAWTRITGDKLCSGSAASSVLTNLLMRSYITLHIPYLTSILHEDSLSSATATPAAGSIRRHGPSQIDINTSSIFL